MIALQLAAAFAIFVLTMYILVAIFLTTLIGLGPWWIAAFVAAFLFYQWTKTQPTRTRR